VIQCDKWHYKKEKKKIRLIIKISVAISNVHLKSNFVVINVEKSKLVNGKYKIENILFWKEMRSCALET
jgi:hypothetical protein